MGQQKNSLTVNLVIQISVFDLIGLASYNLKSNWSAYFQLHSIILSKPHAAFISPIITWGLQRALGESVQHEIHVVRIGRPGGSAHSLPSVLTEPSYREALEMPCSVVVRRLG